MEEGTAHTAAAERWRWGHRIMSVRVVRRLCGIIGLSVFSTFIATGRASAQDQELRLTVRPREMATGTRTERAGRIELKVSTHDTVYVPQQCVGTRRCPLLVYLDAGGWECCATWYGKPKPGIWDWLGPVSEKSGIIILNFLHPRADPENVPTLDEALKETLRTLAIDPEKIAIAGRCATGQHPMTWGDNNQEVFSRMATFTANSGDPPSRPANRSIEYLLANSHGEGQNFEGARMLRGKGYPVKQLSSFREHSHLEEDYDFLAHWLLESWAIPDPAARPKPYTFVAPPPELTTDVMKQMTTFWTRFTKEPDSILIDGRRTHVREVVMPIGTGEISVLMVNMPALAAQYPSVAAALKEAGLTAEQHDAYRYALVSALIGAKPYDLVSDNSSMLAKNIRFMNDHPDEFSALEGTKMWLTP